MLLGVLLVASSIWSSSVKLELRTNNVNSQKVNESIIPCPYEDVILQHESKSLYCHFSIIYAWQSISKNSMDTLKKTQEDIYDSLTNIRCGCELLAYDRNVERIGVFPNISKDVPTAKTPLDRGQANDLAVSITEKIEILRPAIDQQIVNLDEARSEATRAKNMDFMNLATRVGLLPAGMTVDNNRAVRVIDECLTENQALSSFYAATSQGIGSWYGEPKDGDL